jgi:3-oxoacyl-[acyl-carrier protein] reductase
LAGNVFLNFTSPLPIQLGEESVFLDQINKMELEGKKILITGGSSGIGRATAIALKNKGAQVIVTGRNQEKLSRTAFELGLWAKKCDVSQDREIQELKNYVLEKFEGRLDVLINNAGMAGLSAKVEAIDLEVAKETFATNVFGPMAMMRAFGPWMKEQRFGTIVNLGSSSAVKGYAYGAAYVGSKFALRGMTECWREELRPFNIRVCLVNPSEVTTAFGQKDGQERMEIPNKLRSAEVAHAILSLLTMDDRGFIPELNIWATNPF